MIKLTEGKENYTLKEVAKAINLVLKYEGLFEKGKNVFNYAKERFEKGFTGKVTRKSAPDKLIEVQNLILKDYKKYVPSDLRKEAGLNLEKRIKEHINEIQSFKESILGDEHILILV